MKNKLLQYIQEVVMPHEYRDTQVAKIINSSSPKTVIENFYIDNIIFFKGFLDKILNHLMTFPDELDKKNDVYTISEPSSQEDPHLLDDEDEDEEEYEDEYEDEEEYEEEEDEITEESTRPTYVPYETQTREQNKKSINEMGMLTVNTLKKDIMDFKNGNFIDNDLMLYIKRQSPEFADLTNKKIHDERFYKYLYCGILHYYDRYAFLKRLVELRGKNYIWLISHIKDSTFSPYYRKNLTNRVGKKIRERAIIKAIVPNYDKQSFSQSMDEIQKYILSLKSEKEIKKAEEIKTKFEQNPFNYLLDELSIMEARSQLMILFKNIKRRFMQDPRFSKNFSAIGSRKFIFDYETGRPSTLNNEIATDANQLKDLLLKIGYTFNEIEFEVGKVRKGKQLYSLKELIPILKQGITEIKFFSKEKMNELIKLTTELNILPDRNIIENKIKNIENEQIAAIKDILNYDDKTNKKLGELIKEGMATKKEETNSILKKFNRVKLTRLLALIKEKEEIESTDNKITKEDYEKTIELITNMRNISNQKMKIIFTLSPRAFISQSTRANLVRSIKSCMNVFYGLNRKFLVTSLFDGSFVAFLVKVNKDRDGKDIVDSKIIDPVARCVIKPYRNSAGEIYWVPDNVYEENSESNYSDLASKISEIMMMNNMLPKDTYYLNNKANYQDSVDNVRNDIFSDLYYNDEKLKDKMSKQPLSSLMFLKMRFRERFGVANTFKKIYQLPNGNEIFKNIELDNKLDMTEVPKIKTSELSISGTKIKKLNDNLITKKLEIGIGELKNIDNLKHIREIKDLRVINGAKLPKEVLQNENLLNLTYYDGSINYDIKAKHADIYIDNVTINNESIDCYSIIFNKTNLNKIKKISAEEITLNYFVFNDEYNKKIEKIKSEFLPLIKKINDFISFVKSNLAMPNLLKEKIKEFKESDDKENYEAYQYLNKINTQDYDFIYENFMIPITKISIKKEDKRIDDSMLKELFPKRTMLDLNKIDISRLETLKLNSIIATSKETIVDLRRFKNLKSLEISSKSNIIPKFMLPSSLVKMNIVFTMNTIQNLSDLVNLKAFKFNQDTDFTRWPDSVLKNIVNISYLNLNLIDRVNQYSIRKLALTPYFQLYIKISSLRSDRDNIVKIINDNKSSLADKVLITNIDLDGNNSYDLDKVYSERIVFSFSTEEKRKLYKDKVFYFNPKEYTDNKVIIDNDFFDFYLDNFISNENILMLGSYGYSLKIVVKLNDKSPKRIDLRKITEKIIGNEENINVEVNYGATSKRDFTIISNVLVNEIGLSSGITEEKIKYNNFIDINRIKSSRNDFYTYYAKYKEKTIDLDKHIKIKEYCQNYLSVKIDLTAYLEEFDAKYADMFSKISSDDERDITFENFIKNHFEPLTINFSELDKKCARLFFTPYINKNYYGDYKIITILMEKYLYMCESWYLTNNIIDKNMERRLEK